jgi:hypothetical protein
MTACLVFVIPNRGKAPQLSFRKCAQRIEESILFHHRNPNQIPVNGSIDSSLRSEWQLDGPGHGAYRSLAALGMTRWVVIVIRNLSQMGEGSLLLRMAASPLRHGAELP